jgi:hypothetical protein
MAFGGYVNGLAALGISGAAAALSATLLKSELLPEQLVWLGAAGTVVAACMIAISFVFRATLRRQGVRRALACILFVALVVVIGLRSARVVNIEIGGAPHDLLVGATLTPAGRAAHEACKADTTERLVECSGVEAIPILFGGSYWGPYYIYIGDYLLMLAIFVPLISTLDLKEK